LDCNTFLLMNSNTHMLITLILCILFAAAGWYGMLSTKKGDHPGLLNDGSLFFFVISFVFSVIFVVALGDRNNVSNKLSDYNKEKVIQINNCSELSIFMDNGIDDLSYPCIDNYIKINNDALGALSFRKSGLIKMISSLRVKLEKLDDMNTNSMFFAALIKLNVSYSKRRKFVLNDPEKMSLKVYKQWITYTKKLRDIEEDVDHRLKIRELSFRVLGEA